MKVGWLKQEDDGFLSANSTISKQAAAGADMFACRRGVGGWRRHDPPASANSPFSGNLTKLELFSEERRLAAAKFDKVLNQMHNTLFTAWFYTCKFSAQN